MSNSRLQVFKRFALDLANLSKCEERKVAAIIVDRDMKQVLSIGLNGGPSNLQNCLCVVDGRYGCLHAELNALVKCTNMDDNKIMIVTLSPCKMCATAIINAPGGFKAVYYTEEWKDITGINLLKNAGILAIKI
jgi:deoxycytidylate deaminase